MIKPLQFTEELSDVSIGDYEELFSDELRPELVQGMDSNDSVRCGDGVWRPFSTAHYHGFHAAETTETEDYLDPSEKEGYVDY